MTLVVNWLVNAAALYITAWLLPGIAIEGTVSLLLAALVIGLVNALIRPVLLIVTLPITIVTLGLFYFVLNGLLLWLAAALTPGFALAGFLTAVVGALVLSIVATLLHLVVPGD